MRRRAARSLILVLAVAAFLAPRAAHAWGEFDFTPTPSTGPIGSPFYRHLAHDFNLDLHDLVKLERHGFGREEVVTLVLISSATGVNVKEYAKRRLKDQVLLKDLAAEAKLDYPTLERRVRAIKKDIEARGDRNLPPPVYEPSPTPPAPRRRKKSPAPRATPSPSPTPTRSPTPRPSPAPVPAVAP